MTPVDAEVLLEHAPWLQRLARSLVRDAASADDLVQDTWLAALESGPRRIDNPRSWLVGALCNLWRNGCRASTRRRRREERAARHEALPATDQVADCIAQQRLLLGAVEALPPQYRAVVVLRFFEALPPRAIARRLDVPVATVRTRLQRGLHRLREDLDARPGGRESWLPSLGALLPLPRGPALATFLPSMLILMNAPTKFLLVVVTLGAGFGALGLALGRPSNGEEKVSLAAVADPAQGIESAADATPMLRHASPPAQPSSATASAPASERKGPPADAIPLRGRVFDVAGRPFPGIGVALFSGREPEALGEVLARATSGADGAFELARHDQGALLAIDSPDHVTLFSASAGPSARERALVAAEKLVVRGRVVDAARRPLVGVRVLVLAPDDIEARFPAAFDFSRGMVWRATSAADGSFVVPDAPRCPGLLARALAPGEPEARGEVDLATGNVEIVLRERAVSPSDLHGAVVDERGRPLAHVHVGTGSLHAITDRGGEFRLATSQQKAFEQGLAIHAVKPGFRPALVRVEDAGRPLVIELGAQALAIAGRIVGADGAACEGFRVWLRDPTRFAAPRAPVCALESVAAHERAEGDARELPKDLRGWEAVTTDAEGRFRLGGLLDRRYRLAVMNPRTLAVFTSEPVAAGESDVRIALPPEDRIEQLVGRVVSRGGLPVEGVSVQATIVAQSYDDGGGFVHYTHGGARTRTDREGRFILRDVPRRGVFLGIDGETILPTKLGEEAGLGALETQQGRLEICVALRCQLRVELLDTAIANAAIRVVDASDRVLEVSEFSAFGYSSGSSVMLRGGVSKVLGVAEDARALVVLREGKELRRLPLQLVPGQIVTVRL